MAGREPLATLVRRKYWANQRRSRHVMARIARRPGCGKLLTVDSGVVLAGNVGAAFRREPMARVFLADCQPLFNEALEALITRDGTNEVVGQGSTVPQIVAAVGQLKPDLFVIDAGLALGTRPTLIEAVLSDLPNTKVILLAQDTDLELLLQAIRAGAVGVVGKKSGTQTVLRAVQAVLDGEGVVPRAMLPGLFRRLLDMGDRSSDAPLNRLSPREREVLALLGRGWSNAQIGRELYISPHTVRTHVQNILQKLEMHSKLEAATFAMQHELSSRRP
jgi:DNA-binding NarL/FixJ family response regulator